MSTSSSSQSPSTTPSTASPNSQPTANSSPTIKLKPNNSQFTPTPSDVFSLRHTLLHFVPTELANIIITYAEYWPVLTTSREAFDGPAVVPTQKGTEREDGKEGWCYLVSPEIPRLDDVWVKVERVKFSVGVFYEEPERGCEGESTGANSWLEAAILTSPSPSFQPKYPETSPTPALTPKHPNRWHIQSNKGMTSESVCDLTWDSLDGQESTATPDAGAAQERTGRGFVDLLKSGDRVGVMCRDLYRGWVNCIYSVRLDIFYAV